MISFAGRISRLLFGVAILALAPLGAFSQGQTHLQDGLEGLPEAIKPHLKRMAGYGGDLLMYRRLWELKRVRGLPPDEAKQVQEAFLSVANWKDKLFKRIAELAEQGELTAEQSKEHRENQRNHAAEANADTTDIPRVEAAHAKLRLDQKTLSKATDARDLLRQIAEPLGYLDSKDALHLVFPLFESPSEAIQIGDTVWGPLSDSGIQVLRTLQARKVLSDDPFPLEQGLKVKKDWIERHKSIYGVKYRLPYLPKVADAPKQSNKPEAEPYHAPDAPAEQPDVKATAAASPLVDPISSPSRIRIAVWAGGSLLCAIILGLLLKRVLRRS